MATMAPVIILDDDYDEDEIQITRVNKCQVSENVAAQEIPIMGQLQSKCQPCEFGAVAYILIPILEDQSSTNSS